MRLRKKARPPRRLRFKIRCQNCDDLHVRPYSDDFVWCRRCMKGCAEGGHEPDEDSPRRCYICGWSVRAGLPRAKKKGRSG